VKKFKIGDRVRHIFHHEEHGIGNIDSVVNERGLAYRVKWTNGDSPVFELWRNLIRDDYDDFLDKIKDRIK